MIVLLSSLKSLKAWRCFTECPQIYTHIITQVLVQLSDNTHLRMCVIYLKHQSKAIFPLSFNKNAVSIMGRFHCIFYDCFELSVWCVDHVLYICFFVLSMCLSSFFYLRMHWLAGKLETRNWVLHLRWMEVLIHCMQRHIHIYPTLNTRKQYAKRSWQSSKEAKFWQVSHSPSHDLFFLPLTLYPSISPSVIPSSIFRRLSPPISFRPRHVGSIFIPSQERGHTTWIISMALSCMERHEGKI